MNETTLNNIFLIDKYDRYKTTFIGVGEYCWMIQSYHKQCRMWSMCYVSNDFLTVENVEAK
ncbi:hypothetical protein DERP_004820 [Dermatophagoides pteronyssinus]|uniref:Uncharacterized protein n=1 Tax=Dermatophagoides pteronyssinus TaxID=6956 RepID=A0ABQ8JTH0_DERPT|nr:hypothetical protein DERP_004820 [Dermatophagoides pteronyssinus]